MYKITKVFVSLAAIIAAVNFDVLSWGEHSQAVSGGSAHYYHIDLASLLASLGNTTTLLIDARSDMDFNSGHIRGAHSWSSISKTREALVSRSPAEPVIVYCEQTSCGAAEAVAMELTKSGVKNVAVYSAGFQQWLSTKLPVEIGTK